MTEDVTRHTASGNQGEAMGERGLTCCPSSTSALQTLGCSRTASSHRTLPFAERCRCGRSRPRRRSQTLSSLSRLRSVPRRAAARSSSSSLSLLSASVAGALPSNLWHGSRGWVEAQLGSARTWSRAAARSGTRSGLRGGRC
eukprot:3285926-Rhodomonas_salina.4